MKTLDSAICLRAFETDPVVATAINAGYQGFTDLGDGCAHDAPITGILGVIIAYEQNRTPEMAAKLIALHKDATPPS